KFCVGISLFHAAWNVKEALPEFSESLLPFGLVPKFEDEGDGLLYTTSIAFGAIDLFDVVDYIEAIIIEGIDFIPAGDDAIARIKAAIRLIGDIVSCEDQINRQRYSLEFVQRMVNAYGSRFQEEDQLIDLTVPFDALPPNVDFADETLYFDLKAFPSLIDAETSPPEVYRELINGPYSEFMAAVLDLALLEAQPANETLVRRQHQRRAGGTPGQTVMTNVATAAAGPNPAAAVTTALNTAQSQSGPTPPNFWPVFKQVVLKPNARTITNILRKSVSGVSLAAKSAVLGRIGKVGVDAAKESKTTAGTVVATTFAVGEAALKENPGIRNEFQKAAQLDIDYETEGKVLSFFKVLGYTTGRDRDARIDTYAQIFSQLSATAGKGATHEKLGKNEIVGAWDNGNLNFPKFLGRAIGRVFKEDPSKADSLVAMFDSLQYNYDDQSILVFSDAEFMLELERALEGGDAGEKEKAGKFLDKFRLKNQGRRVVQRYLDLKNKQGL
ncbi:hypothetical protein HDU67_004017, partial [Dinochytrium kinnereticum]